MRRFLLFFCILIPILLWAEETGKIVGFVYDEESGEPLIGVNVLVKGTYMGAAADENGVFRIDGVPPGSYDLQISMIGYEMVLYTGVKVEPGKETPLKVPMKRTVLALGYEVKVIGKKPLLEPDVTSSVHLIDREDIQGIVGDGAKDLLSLQVGVLNTGKEFHIRGGRSDENIMRIDGVAVKDPLFGSSFVMHLSKDVIREMEVITGGFNAEYGQAMSGVVDVKLRDGSEKFQGSMSYKCNHFPLPDTLNTDVGEVHIEGTEPLLTWLLPGRVTFLLNGYLNFSDTYLPDADSLYSSVYGGRLLCPREENTLSGLSRITWKISTTKKLRFTFMNSLKINQGYFMKEYGFPYKYVQILNNYNTFTQEVNRQTVEWWHSASKSMYYTVSVGRCFTRLHSDVQGKHWTEYIPTANELPVEYILNPDSTITVISGDGFYDYGDAPLWHDHYAETYTLTGNVCYQPSVKTKIKSGLEVDFTELQLLDIYKPWLGESNLGLNFDLYCIHTSTGAFYIQDRITYEGMILNVGMRVDWWFLGPEVEEAMEDTNIVTLTEEARERFYNETVGVFGHRMKAHISPRLGVSHPVTDNDVLFFSYGHFSQRPRYQYVYAKLRSYSESTYQLFGNPNLNPSVTIAYEMGIRHRFDENKVFTLTAFYKDIFGYPTAQRIIMYNPRYGNIRYLMYFNADFATVRGIELVYKQRAEKYLSGSAKFSYSLATGKSSNPDDELLISAGRLTEKPMREVPLKWDRPLGFSFTLNFNVGKDEHPVVFGWKLPSNWGVSVQGGIRSGQRYTPITRIIKDGVHYDDYGELYSAIGTPWRFFDAKFYKSWKLGSVDISFVVECRNVFNFRNARIINPLTGDAYKEGDLYPLSYDRPFATPPDNPARYTKPRDLRMGVSIRW